MQPGMYSSYVLLQDACINQGLHNKVGFIYVLFASNWKNQLDQTYFN